MSADILWIPATLIAASAQTARNATQRSLTQALGVIAAAQVRFLFGLPFALAILSLIVVIEGQAPPSLNPDALTYGALGALAQMTAMMVQLAGMRRHDFVAITAMAKTEPVMVALLSAVILGETFGVWVWIGVALATLGVVIMTLARGRAVLHLQAVALGLGLVAGLLFACSAMWMRASLLALEAGPTALKAAAITVYFLTLQALATSLYLAMFNRAALRAIAKAWRPSMSAGILGAIATTGWSWALALASAASVRTLGLVEVLMADLVGRRFFAEKPRPAEILGMILILAGAGLVVIHAA